MDKHCKDCIYQGFKAADQFQSYGFCMCEKHQSIEFWKEATSQTYKFLEGLSIYKPDKITEKNIKDRYLSCLMVQSVYEGECPYKEVLIKISIAPPEVQKRNGTIITKECLEKIIKELN